MILSSTISLCTYLHPNTTIAYTSNQIKIICIFKRLKAPFFPKHVARTSAQGPSPTRQPPRILLRTPKTHRFRTAASPQLSRCAPVAVCSLSARQKVGAGRRKRGHGPCPVPARPVALAHHSNLLQLQAGEKLQNPHNISPPAQASTRRLAPSEAGPGHTSQAAAAECRPDPANPARRKRERPRPHSHRAETPRAPPVKRRGGVLIGIRNAKSIHPKRRTLHTSVLVPEKS